MIRQLRSAPNLLTLLRLIFIPFVVIAVQQQRYMWALGIFIVAGVTDGLDGLLARVFNQKTLLGQYLDPIADKLLLSTMFLVLSLFHQIIRWPVTILVFSRDIMIVTVCSVLYATGAMKIFRPSWLGKANTVAQIVTVPFALLAEVSAARWVHIGKHLGIYATVALTIISGIHYIVRVGFTLRHTGSRAMEPELRGNINSAGES